MVKDYHTTVVQLNSGKRGGGGKEKSMLFIQEKGQGVKN